MPGTQNKYFKYKSLRELTSASYAAMRKIPSNIFEANLKLAKKLHENRAIYTIFAIVDGISLSYSLLNYILSMLTVTHPELLAEFMHDLLTNPFGLLAICLEIIFIVNFAFFANLFEKNHPRLIQKLITASWDYFRDALKAIKNAFKGIRTVIQVCGWLGEVNLTAVLLPTVLAFGIVSMVNRIWIRYMRDARKNIDKFNKELLDKIKNSNDIYECIQFGKEIKKQSTNTRRLAILSSAYAGLVDGPYLYIGLLSLCFLPWHLLLAMAVISLICIIFCVAFRVYEEVEMQREIDISRIEIQLEVCKIKHRSTIAELFDELISVSQQLSEQSLKENAALLKLRQELAKKLLLKLQPLIEKRAELQSLVTQSKLSAILAGMKVGLAAYGVTTAIMFSISTFLIIANCAFPPAVVVTVISLSLLWLTAFITYFLVNYNKYVNKQKLANSPKSQFEKTICQLKNISKTTTEDLQKGKDNLETVLKVEPREDIYWEEGIELGRAGASGVGKVYKVLTEFPTDGDNKEALYTLTALGSAINGGILLARADAKGFGKVSSTKTEKKKEDNQPDITIETTPPIVAPPRRKPSTIGSSFINSPRSFFPPTPKNKDSSPIPPATAADPIFAPG